MRRPARKPPSSRHRRQMAKHRSRVPHRPGNNPPHTPPSRSCRCPSSPLTARRYSSGGQRATTQATTADLSPDGKPRRNGYGSSGTDLTALNQLGMDITMAYEVSRLRRKGISARIFDPDEPGSDDTLIFDVSTPAAIMPHQTASPQFKAVLTHLTSCDVAPDFPGFDVMTLAPGNSTWPERMIELKSSGVNARIQEMTWNEWKTAQHSQVRPYFYLYLVGNLRADLPNAPFIRTVHDPFANLWNSTTTTETTVRRTVQLNTQEFDAAEELTLGVVPGSPET